MTDQNGAIRVTELPSGLKIVTERMDRVETVSFGAYVASGTRHELAEENGASHFLEHMAFKGTERRSASAIAEEIEAVGGHINAYTARLAPTVVINLLTELMHPAGGRVSGGDVGLPVAADGKVLPCGIYGRWEA